MGTLTVKDIPVATVEPPSLRRLGEAELRAFQRDGFLLKPALFDPAEIGLLQRLTQEDAAVERAMGCVADSQGNANEIFGFAGTPPDVLGAFIRIARLVEMASDLLDGQTPYHWHSKLTFKPPGSQGRWDWHQDYGSWYKDGAIFPDSLTAMIAVTPIDRKNGCVELVRGSHLCGRIDHLAIGEANGADPERVAWLLERSDRVLCELDPGDCVFFHSNTLHASGPNDSTRPRTIFHVSYNAEASAPPSGHGLAGHQFAPLEILPDDALKTRDWDARIDLEAHRAMRLARETERTKLGDLYGYRVTRKHPEEAL